MSKQMADPAAQRVARGGTGRVPADPLLRVYRARKNLFLTTKQIAILSIYGLTFHIRNKTVGVRGDRTFRTER